MALLTAQSPWSRVLRAPAAALLLALALAGGFMRAATPAPASSEYQVKAVFLFNFAQFVEWPKASLGADDSPLVITILGDDPFGTYLDELVKDESVGRHPLVVRRCRTVAEVDGSHIVYVCRSESAKLRQIISALRQRSILTISDVDAFTRLGGMVGFVTENGKVRLRINIGAARQAGLILSSKLLRPATIVSTGRD